MFRFIACGVVVESVGVEVMLGHGVEGGVGLGVGKLLAPVWVPLFGSE